jgi:hypothetical protein
MKRFHTVLSAVRLGGLAVRQRVDQLLLEWAASEKTRPMPRWWR